MLHPDLSHNGIDGLALAMKGNYDLILLDAMLPGIDGWEVVKRLRDGGMATPVIFVTARDAVGDRVTGLQLGGDDYLASRSPFPNWQHAFRPSCGAARSCNPTCSGWPTSRSISSPTPRCAAASAST